MVNYIFLCVCDLFICKLEYWNSLWDRT